jgi:cytochrome c551
MKMLIKTSVAMLGFAMIFSTWSLAQDAGGDLFKSKCAMCHGPDGKGDTAMGKKFALRDLASADVQKQSDAELSGIITKGKGKMPPYEGKLTSDQVQSVVKFIRTLKK